ncbi:MAG: sugar transporter [Rhodobacteraceae bacterium]|nr:sugar transporter [Paracoccaceae bacterium]
MILTNTQSSSTDATDFAGNDPAAPAPRRKKRRKPGFTEDIRPERQAAPASRHKKRRKAAARGETVVIRPVAPRARTRTRHWGLVLSFVLFACLPPVGIYWYLYERAMDQYASTLGFTVRREEAPAATDILTNLTGLSGASSADSDILYEFIQSQELVRKVDERLDLRSLYAAHYNQDFWFGLKPDATIEELTSHWHRMVRVSYEPGSGLISLQALAFTAGDATAIAQAIYAESLNMINQLSAIARADVTRYAEEDLNQAVERLVVARQAITDFRSRTQIADPQSDIQVQMGLLTTLQQELATELINYDLLQETTRESDPRITEAKRRIDAIRALIDAERKKFGVGGQGPGGEDYATLISEFERLTVDREFAEQTYVAALAAFDSARAEAQRQSRYLAAYVQPTRPESPEYPQREVILGLSILFSIVFWAVLALIYYSLRDRR